MIEVSISAQGWRAAGGRLPEGAEQFYCEESQVLTNHTLRTLRRRDMPGAISLRKRRSWFADDPGDGADEGGNGEGEGDSGDENGQVPIDSLPKAVQDLITDLRQQAANYRTKYKELNDQVSKDTESRLAQNQQYKELADKRGLKIQELEPLAEQAKDAAEFLKALNAQSIEAIPEAMRTMVPDFGESYEGQKRQAAWLKANAAKLSKPPAPDFDAGAGAGNNNGSGTAPVQLTPAEKEYAQAAGMSDKQYAEYKAKRGQPVELKPKE